MIKIKELLKRAFVLCFSMFYLTSCLLISSPGGKQKVFVDTDGTEDVKVEVDGLEVSNAPGYYKLKKKKSHEILFSKENYLDENIELKAHMNVGLYMAAVYSWFAIVPAVFDAFGSAYSAPFKKIELDLIKKPLKTENTTLFSIDEISFNVDPGKKIGSHYTLKKDMSKTFVSSHTWGDETNLQATKFEDIASDDLKDIGYNVVNTNESSLSSNGYSKLRLGAEIKSIEYNSYYLRSNKIFECSYDIKWIFKNSRGAEIKSINRKVTTKKYNGEPASVVVKAFRKALYEFVETEEFKNVFNEIEKKNDVEDEKLVLSKSELTTFDSNEELFKSVTASVVTISTEYGHGSGFVIGENGYVLTNFHVINDAKNIEVSFENGMKMDAEILKFNSEYDLAIVKIAGKGYKPLPMVTENTYSLGKDVYAVGTPADKELGQTVTKGILSGKRKFDDKTYYQTDVSINGGNSGGPLIDKNGNVLGVVNAKMMGKGVEGLGFAIPINVAIEKIGIEFK